MLLELASDIWVSPVFIWKRKQMQLVSLPLGSQGTVSISTLWRFSPCVGNSLFTLLGHWIISRLSSFLCAHSPWSAWRGGQCRVTFARRIYNPYMWNLKSNETGELTKQKETHLLKRMNLQLLVGGMGEAIVRELGMDVYTRWVYIFKMDNEQGPTI